MLVRTALTLGITVLMGCEKNRQPTPPALTTVHTLNHDFGEISIDNGPVRLEHTFRMANATTRAMEIKDIKKSCGCVEAIASSRRIEPGDTLNVTLGLELKQPGRIEQSATIICKDDRLIPMHVLATGTRELEFIPILIERTPVDGKVPIRFLLVGKGEISDNETIEIISPTGMGLEFDGWRAIERASTSPGRPTRLVGAGRLDLTSFKGQLPVTVTFRAARFMEHSIDLGEPAAPSCR